MKYPEGLKKNKKIKNYPKTFAAAPLARYILPVPPESIAPERGKACGDHEGRLV